MITDIITPHETARSLAKQAQEKRLSLNLSQQTLAKRAGISYGVLKKFERTGQISLESLLKIALILGCLEPFRQLFAVSCAIQPVSLDDLLKDNKRKRGRL